MAKRDLKYIGIIYLLLKAPLEPDEFDTVSRIRRDVPDLEEWQRQCLDALVDRYFKKEVS